MADNKDNIIETDGHPVFSESARLWHSAFIGKTGSGKTYAARGEVEDLLDLGRQVVIIDPTGAWSGLRMRPDGSPSGYDIAIFGGKYGDKPLVPDMAPGLGRIAGSTTRSMILDLSGISLELEDQREIVYQFLRNLYRMNRKPVHLVIDEADEFAPQDLDKDTKQLRTLVGRIMARGRSLGFRCTLITQRPAKIDKNSISQIESMAVLRVTAPQDRSAVVDWFSDKGGADRKEILNGLGSLQTGEGWVFTGLDGTYEHRRFRKIRTYDSSSTPVDEQGNVIELNTGYIDLKIFDEQLTYPEDSDEADLEKTVARRRNLEQDNRNLRARLLKAESRYEAMRRAFVNIRNAVDAALMEDSFEAVEYADLVLLRDEVAQDVKELEKANELTAFDLNDINGVPEMKESYPLSVLGNADQREMINPASIPETESTILSKTIDMPDDRQKEALKFFKRRMSTNEIEIIQALDTKPQSIAEISKAFDMKESTIERNFQRMLDEKCIEKDVGNTFKVTIYGICRTLSDIQAKALVTYVEDPMLAEDTVKSVTSGVLKRYGILNSQSMPTSRGYEVYEIYRKLI